MTISKPENQGQGYSKLRNIGWEIPEAKLLWEIVKRKLKQCFSKCGPLSAWVSIIWEWFVNSQVILSLLGDSQIWESIHKWLGGGGRLGKKEWYYYKFCSSLGDSKNSLLIFYSLNVFVFLLVQRQNDERLSPRMC